MFRKLCISTLLLLFISATCTTISYAIGRSFARLVSFKGDVAVYREAKSIPVKRGIMLKQADKIKTGKDSFADIAFDKAKKNIIRIEEDSELILENLNPKAMELDLFKGSVLSRVKRLKRKSTFIIRTPISISGARGSGWRVAKGLFKDTVESHEDKIFVAGLDEAGNFIGETTLEAGWKMFVEKFAKPAGLAELSGLEKDGWNRWKEALKETAAPDRESTRIIERKIDKAAERKENLFEALDGKRIEDRTGSGGDDNQKYIER